MYYFRMIIFLRRKSEVGRPKNEKFDHSDNQATGN
jgi:hypothetical protein